MLPGWIRLMKCEYLMCTDQQISLPDRLQDGEQEALTEAFALHRERLWRMINFRMDRRLAARVDPDDILQEAYLDAERRLQYFRADQGGSVFMWLRLICRQTLVNVFRRHLESSGRDASREVSLQQQMNAQSTSISIARQFVASATSPSQAAAQRETTAQLIEALEAMDPMDREIIALRHFEDLRNIEVAAVLDIMPTAASNRYVRAITRLRKVLGQFQGPSPAEGMPNDE